MNVPGNDRNNSILTGMMNKFAICSLALLFIRGLPAETPCPAHIKPVPFHNSRQHQMVVQVMINNAGPYDFLLDTGTQMTIVDRSLAAELGLLTSGNAIVAGISFQGQIKFAQVEMLKLGENGSTKHRVLVYDMKKVQGVRFALRGLLGEDFLSRFDVFIDNAHSVLCMDDTGAMEAGVKGGLQPKGK
jgi:predicted aspartyl protease